MFLTLRRLYQVVFFALFVFLVLAASASLLGGFPVEWFLGLDPLVALSTALAGGNLHAPMAWAIGLVVVTIVFGRFFCGWMCPMGAMHHFLGHLGRRKRIRDQVTVNLPKGAYKVKYVILLVMLGMAAMGSTQVGLLDPIAFTWRAFATSIVPAADNTALGLYQGERHFHFSTLIIVLFLAALSLNFFVPRLYCRMLCPLGALLGLLARFSLFRMRRKVEVCRECVICSAACQGAAEPHARLRVSECMLCLNCTQKCPRGGMAYGFLPSKDVTTNGIDLGRRRWVGATVAGIAAVPLMRASDGVEPRPHPLRIRPPGALAEEDFLARCLKCGACMKVCPTGGLQPALHEAGFEGLWSPILVPRIGYCEQACVLCGRVCPTGAIEALSVARKIGEPPHKEPVRVGTAFIDRGRCLPWAMDTPCIICEEVCPTSPKAVHFKRVKVKDRDGRVRILKRPQVDATRCVGCGTCEARCAVFDKAAIRVTSVGETRSPSNRIVLGGQI